MTVAWDIYLKEGNSNYASVNPQNFHLVFPSSSKCIRFGSKFPGMEMDDKVETGKVFGPMCLSMHEDFGY